VWVERADVIKHAVVMTCLPDITKSQISRNNDRPYRRTGETRRRPATLFQSFSSGKNRFYIQSQNTVGNQEMGVPFRSVVLASIAISCKQLTVTVLGS